MLSSSFSDNEENTPSQNNNIKISDKKSNKNNNDKKIKEKEISELFNVKSDTNLKEQIKEIKNLKKKYFNVIKKYYDIENNKR